MGAQLRRFRLQGVEGGAVTFSEVHHVDLVAHAAAVGGEPVVAKNLQFGPLAHRPLADEREQDVGRAQRVFADVATGVGPKGLK